MVWGCINAYRTVYLHIWNGTINAERHIQVLKHHMLPSRWSLLQGRRCIFQQDTVKSHTVSITTAWLRSRRVWVLDWPACSPDLSLTENIWHIMKRHMWQRRHIPVPTIFEMCHCHQIRDKLIFFMILHSIPTYLEFRLYLIIKKGHSILVSAKPFEKRWDIHVTTELNHVLFHNTC